MDNTLESDRSTIIVEKSISLNVQGADIVEKFNELGELREMLREFKVKLTNPLDFNLFLESVPPTS